MQYRKFGKTGEQVSALGFGMMRLPLLDKNPEHINEEEARNIVRYAIDQGVNYIDTAYPYHGASIDAGGQSEPLTGRVLRGGYRQKVKLATKLPSWLIQKEADFDRILNEQLERLQTDYIDFYLIHTLDRRHWPQVKEAGLFKFMERALSSGRVKHLGFSFHDEFSLFKEIVDAYDWEFCQIQYNYLDERYQAGKAGLEYAAGKGLGVVVMEPLRGGALVDGIVPAARDLFRQAHPWKTEAGWGLEWVLNHPEVSVVLSGMSALEHVQENIAVASRAEAGSMKPADLEVIEQVKKILEGGNKIRCTSCGYCMPCPNGVNIPENFKLYNVAFALNRLEASRFSYGLLSDKQQACYCVECGSCEPRCPQNIPIIKSLKEVHRTLKG
jgi:predicted aldo/keto reductase-like oxidoreductase